MMGNFIFVIGLILMVPLALVIGIFVKLSSHSRRISDLDMEILDLKSVLRELKSKSVSVHSPRGETLSQAALPQTIQSDVIESTHVSLKSDVFGVAESVVKAVPPPVPVSANFEHVQSPKMEVSVMTPLKKVSVGVEKKSELTLEHFLGVKLFAWIGGLMAFLAVVFFIKYSFENNLLSPPVRVALGYLTGFGLLVGGLKMSRERYAFTVQGLCSAGILVLYAATFASHRFYGFLSSGPTFALMVLITFLAFLLSVRLESQAIAILGWVGGFITPPLLSTGEDRPLALFVYVGLLDAGLVAVALRQRWHHLVMLAVVATGLMELGWFVKFFESSKVWTAVLIMCSFALFFTVTWWVGFIKKLNHTRLVPSVVASLIPGILFVLVQLMGGAEGVGNRPLILFGILFFFDWLILGTVLREHENRSVLNMLGGLIFGLLFLWMRSFASEELLNYGLGLILLFAVFHSVVPVVLHRKDPSESGTSFVGFFPLIALGVALVPVIILPALPVLIWPVILLIDLLVIGLAVFWGSMLLVSSALVMTLIGMGIWLFRLPPVVTQVMPFLCLIGGFSLFFFAAGVWVTRCLGGLKTQGGGISQNWVLNSEIEKNAQAKQMMAQVPALAGLLPFILLVMMVVKIHPESPSMIFGLAMGFLVMMFAVVRLYQVDGLMLVALGSVSLLEWVYHHVAFRGDRPETLLIWHLVFPMIFAVFPFLHTTRFQNRLLPWVTSALAGPIHFYLVHRLVVLYFKNPFMGVVPILFAIPSLIGLIRLLRTIPRESFLRNTQLALFGGVVLFFITLVFPIQFNKQWITMGWALEGWALIWLFHRIPHQGLKKVGTFLLSVAFVRLALNPSIFEYHMRSGIPIFNWYFYAYGIVIVCLFATAHLLRAPENRVWGKNMPPILRGMGAVLAFYLLNIEIADFFSTGSRLDFRFSGSFAQDMTCSMAWSLFSLTLLIFGLRTRAALARYAGLALLTFTLLKLFFHDLWNLGGLYRVGSLIGLAVVLMLVSFIYQKFLSNRKDDTCLKKQQDSL